MPEHLSHGIPKGQVHDFMYGFHSMVLQILRARAHREDVQLFDQPKTKQGRGYPSVVHRAATAAGAQGAAADSPTHSSRVAVGLRLS